MNERPMTANDTSPIYTIGHANRTPAQLIELLQKRQIAFLIDVRTPAEQAAAADFAPAALAAQLEAAAVCYVSFAVAFADAPPIAAGELNYPAVRATAAYQQTVARLQTAFQKQQRVALLGASADPARCQRCQLFGASLQAAAIPVVHVDQTGGTQSQEEVIWAWASEALAMAEFADEAVPYEDAFYEKAPAPASPVAHPTYDNPLDALQRVYGYDSFRPLQAEIIANVLNRRDTLVIMPTGGGKSLCYQLPALLLNGLTLVVSPLIALMQDQVAARRRAGGAAAGLNT
jgi:ATP-dependent DNA helicase RecQ